MYEKANPNHEHGQAPLDSLPEATVNLTSLIQQELSIQIRGEVAAELFMEASRNHGYSNYFASVYALEKTLLAAGFEVKKDVCQSAEGGLAPTVLLSVTDSEGHSVVPGIHSSSLYESQERGGGSADPKNKLVSAGTEFEDPVSGQKLSFQVERFSAEAVLVLTPDSDSPDVPYTISVHHSPLNHEQIEANANAWLECHGEVYSYVLEDVVLPLVQRDLVERSGHVMGERERPEVDFEHSSYNSLGPSVVLSAYMSGAFETRLVEYQIALLDDGRSPVILDATVHEPELNLDLESL